MNIAIIGRSLNLRSGHSLPAFSLAGYFQAQGHKVIMLSDRSPEGRRNSPAVSSWIPPDDRRSDGSIERVAWRFGKLDSYGTALRGIDVVHEFDYVSPRDIRKVLGRDVPVVYQASSRLRMTLADIAAAGPHGLLNLGQLRFQRSLILPKVVLKRMISHFHTIVCTSRFVADGIRDLGVPESRIRVVPAWLGNLGAPRVRVRPSANSPSVLYFGWGSSIRGLPDLLEAHELMRRAGFKVSLDIFLQDTHGIEEWLMKRIVTRRSLKGGLTLRGFQADILQQLASANCVVLPFRSSFGYAHPPLTLLEAMSSGIPVISTIVGSIPELVTDRETGYIVRPRQPRALAKTIQHVVFDCPEEAERVGREAASHIRANHGIELAGEKLLGIYRRLIDNEQALNDSDHPLIET